MATPRRAADFFEQLSWQELQCGLLVACCGKRTPAPSSRATEIAPKATDFAQAVADYRLWRHIGVPPTGLYALARFLDYQCDEDASFAQSNARAALCAITGAVAATHSKDAIKHAAHLPFGGFKESEIAAFLRRMELTGLASELSRE
jgi:hypothetical protein